MRRRGLLLAGLLLAACGDFALPRPDAGAGPTCYADTDCVPNGCCGKGDAVVHVSLGPDCTTVKCSGSCPPTGIKCGCAVPVCRNSRCTSAIDPSCP